MGVAGISKSYNSIKKKSEKCQQNNAGTFFMVKYYLAVNQLHAITHI